MPDNSLDSLQDRIDVSGWEWQELPYTDEEWAALYWPSGSGSTGNISEQYREMHYQPLTSDKFLLKMDESLWLVELFTDDRIGTCIWSIYSLVPESDTGVTQ